MPPRRKHTWILVVCIAILLVLIFFEPAYGWRVQQWISRSGSANPIGQADDATLQAQNQSLESELAVLDSVAAQIPQNPANDIRALVYVRYPFGFKNELLINAGTDEGVATGDVAIFQNVFVGSVMQVYPDSAVVETIFDPSFKMPVRLSDMPSGTASVASDALLIGGADPKATSISKSASISNGDPIYTAGPGVPYGLLIGTVNATSVSSDNLFKEASIDFPYDIAGITTLLIRR